MCLVVDLCKVLKIKVGIDLRGADIRVPEQFLHSPKVAAGFQQMTGKGVPQGVRVDIARDTLSTRHVLDALLYGTYPQPLATATSKDGRMAVVLRAHLLPGMQGADGLGAHR